MHTKKRNGEIDFWKFVFSLVIVVFHTFHYKSIFGLQPFIGGSSSVEFFFIVSGFLMAQSASRIISGEFKIAEETRNFMLRKIKGLYPEFAIAWLFGFVVMHLGKESVSFGKVVKDLMTGSWELFLLRMSGFVNTDQTEHTARRFSAWLPPIQCTLSGHQCMMLIQV